MTELWDFKLLIKQKKRVSKVSFTEEFGEINVEYFHVKGMNIIPWNKEGKNVGEDSRLAGYVSTSADIYCNLAENLNKWKEIY